MLWQEYIPYIFSNLIFGPWPFQWCLILATNKIPFSWENKSISKIMCSQKYGDLYIISYLLPTMIFCMYMQLPSYKTLISTPFENNTSGKYITPHIFLYQTFLKTIKWWVETFFKHQLVIIECDHFYKIVLLIMEMVVRLIHVVWIVWSWLWCEYCVFWCVCLLNKIMKRRKETKSKHQHIK